MIDRLFALWELRATRITTALGVVIVLGVWTVAITAIVQFSQPAVAAAGAPGVASRAAGQPVQDLASLGTPTPSPAAVAVSGETGTVSGPVAGPVAAIAAPLSSTQAGSVATSTVPAGLTSTTSTTTDATTATSSTVVTGSETVVDNAAQTAAQRYGWGAPTKIDTFDNPALPGWERYDGPGHQGKGIRSPNAITAANGVLTINGDASGTTGGMAWGQGQTYGRWEGRMRAPVGDASYHALMLLWPDAENWPVGGEVDFVEISDAARRSVDGFLHYGAANNQDSGTIATDATQWHAWAVEWAPSGITYFLDGVPWFHVTDTSHLPPGPMHLCLQLDWFPEGSGAVTPTEMQVDDVAYYPLNGSGTSPVIAPGAGATVTPTTVQTIAPGSGTGITTTTTSPTATTTTAVTPTTTAAPATTTAPVTTTTAAPTTTAATTTTSAPVPTTTSVPTPTPTPSPVETTPAASTSSTPTDTSSAAPTTTSDPTTTTSSQETTTGKTQSADSTSKSESTSS